MVEVVRAGQSTSVDYNESYGSQESENQRGEVTQKRQNMNYYLQIGGYKG